MRTLLRQTVLTRVQTQDVQMKARAGGQSPSSVVLRPKSETARRGMRVERPPFAVANMTALTAAMAQKSAFLKSCRVLTSNRRLCKITHRTLSGADVDRLPAFR